MRINLIFPFFVIYLLFLSTTYANDECKYNSEINQCLEIVKQWWSERSIEEFVCIVPDNIWTRDAREQVTYQIILDMKFREIDAEVNQYILWLEEAKDRFFGKNATQSYLVWIDEIEWQFKEWGYFDRKYRAVCWVQLASETASCMWDWYTTLSRSKDFFKETNCTNLAKTKIKIARDMAYSMMKINKAQVRKDEAKRYVWQERDKYTELTELFMLNLSYVERIWKKWSSKIKNTLK